MCLHSQWIDEVPDETARVARAAFPKGTLYLTIRDQLGTVYDDSAFSTLFSVTGQPALAARRLAWVTVLEFAEGLSDRQAAEAVRSRIDWKYLLGLPLEDDGFDYSVLSEFRGRLVAGELEYQLLDALLNVCQRQGWLKAGSRSRTDSTHVLAAVEHLHRYELVKAVLEAALNRCAQVAPDWLIAWYRCCGSAATGSARLQCVHQVWPQQYVFTLGLSDQVQWRDKTQLPAASQRIASPYDTQARYSTKGSTEWVGYKIHVTETCEADAPHLITHATHSGPFVRGIHATVRARVTEPVHEPLALFREAYAGRPFVRVTDAPPELSAVVGWNFAHVRAVARDGGREVIATCVIDNLVKGAAGQTIQAMNLALGFDETEGLAFPGIYPC